MGMAGLETQPGATTYDLEDLVASAWAGRVRVPHFQRDFRWATQDVLRLFDSIVRGYPIGSLLLWVRKSPPQDLTLGSLRIAAPAFDETLWVVDGQQRITSLANALHRDGHPHVPFNVYYDLVETRFIAQPGACGPQHIPLPVLFDLELLIDWFANEGRVASDHFKEAQRVAKRLRQFKVPVYLVRQENESILTDIFDRMNSYGKRLSRAEIFSALFAGPEEAAESRLSLSRIADRVASRTGFGGIDTDTVLSSILARRGPDPSRDIRNEFDTSSRRTPSEFPDEDQNTAYEQGEEALVRAVDFLQNYVGVPHLSLLAYRAPLVVLARFFAHFPAPMPSSLRLLRRLYWRVAVSGPAVFRGSFTQVGRVLSARIRKGDEHASIAGLMAAMAEARPTVPNPERFRTNEATTKIVLSSWWSLGPRSLVTCQRFDAQQLSTLLADQSTAATVAHRIFPRGLTAERQLLAANRLFMPTDADPVSELPMLLTRPHVEVDDATWDAVLASHCLDRTTVELLVKGDQDEFLTRRQELITDQLRGFLSQAAEWDYEDTPGLESLDFDDLEEVGEVTE